MLNDLSKYGNLRNWHQKCYMPERYVQYYLMLFSDELYLSPVLSKMAHADIVSVDASEALKIPGVEGYFDHTHIPGKNNFGILEEDEELFASKTVSAKMFYLADL